MTHQLRILFLVVACLLISAAASAQDRGPLRHGRQLLREFCGQCHAIGRTDIKRGAPPFRTLGRELNLDGFERKLERGISSTHPAMPEVKFTEEDARDAVAYLRSIQK